MTLCQSGLSVCTISLMSWNNNNNNINAEYQTKMNLELFLLTRIYLDTQVILLWLTSLACDVSLSFDLASAIANTNLT